MVIVFDFHITMSNYSISYQQPPPAYTFYCHGDPDSQDLQLYLGSSENSSHSAFFIEKRHHKGPFNSAAYDILVFHGSGRLSSVAVAGAGNIEAGSLHSRPQLSLNFPQHLRVHSAELQNDSEGWIWNSNGVKWWNYQLEDMTGNRLALIRLEASKGGRLGTKKKAPVLDVPGADGEWVTFVTSAFALLEYEQWKRRKSVAEVHLAMETTLYVVK